MDQIDVQDPLYTRIEDRKPILAFSLLIWPHPIRVEVC